MPVCASPAIESPAMTATAIGRNSGSTMASAATANSEPCDSTADRNAGPCPGRGPILRDGEQDGDDVGSRSSRTMR